MVGAIGHLGVDAHEPVVPASHSRSGDASILSRRMAALSAEATENVTKYALPRLVAPPTLCKSCKESCQKLNQPMEVFDISCRAKMRSEDECLVMDGYRASIDFGIVSVGEMKVNNNCVNNCDYDCVTENRQNWWCRVVK